MATTALELLYPSQANCMGCGSRIGADEGWLCDECIEYLTPAHLLSDWRCQKCGRPLARSGRCKYCKRWAIGAIDMARFAYPYRRPIDGMIRRMKYHGVRAMAPQMGMEIANMWISGAYPAVDIVVPVPMHTRRLRERGFNHAALIAREAAAQLGVAYQDVLVRTRHTKQQAKLGQLQRERNMRDAFSCPSPISGLRVLLVDDVLTSGATAVHCALALREAGAKRVYVATVAGAID